MPAMLDVESSNVKILLRDFDLSGLEAKEKMLRDMVAANAAKFPEVKIDDRRQRELPEHERGPEELSAADRQRDGGRKASRR